jgi:hypothetical protein
VTTPVPPEAFAVFDQQDSGCLSYGIDLNGQRLLVKIATTVPARESPGRAILFHRAVRHPAIVSPIDVVDTKTRRQLVYPWVDGVVLNHATTARSNRSGLERFLALDPDEIRAAIEMILDAHLAIAANGFVSVDLYDGCLLYDFEHMTMDLINRDEYRPGPFVVSVNWRSRTRRHPARAGLGTTLPATPIGSHGRCASPGSASARVLRPSIHQATTPPGTTPTRVAPIASAALAPPRISSVTKNANRGTTKKRAPRTRCVSMKRRRTFTSPARQDHLTRSDLRSIIRVCPRGRPSAPPRQSAVVRCA